MQTQISRKIIYTDGEFMIIYGCDKPKRLGGCAEVDTTVDILSRYRRGLFKNETKRYRDAIVDMCIVHQDLLPTPHGGNYL